MKRYFILVLLSVISFTSFAQYRVFSLSGDVKYKKKGTSWQELYKGTLLNITDSISMVDYSTLSIADGKSRNIIPVQVVGQHTLAELLKENQPQKSNMLKRCWKTVVAILNGEPASVAQGAAGTTYKNSSERFDIHTNNMRMADALTNYLTSNLISHGNYRVELKLIDETYTERENVYDGERLHALVFNHSDTPLFISLLDIDNEGVLTSVLPSDIETMLTQMLVPPLSTIIIPYPIEFVGSGTDRLYLIASPEVFDLEQVVEILKKDNSLIEKQPNTISIGISQYQINIQ